MPYLMGHLHAAMTLMVLASLQDDGPAEGCYKPGRFQEMGGWHGQ